MNNPLISIVIPCYNQAQFLEEALNSIYQQTYINWECIIVNDGSTDYTEELAIKWSQKDSRFKYIFKTNGGLSKARNVGLDKARGDYIQFLDSDDYIDLKKLEIQIQDLNNCEISICDYFAFIDGTNDKAPYKYLSPFFSKSEYKKEIIWDWEYRKSFPPHCPLFKKKLIDVNNLRFNESLPNHEDWEFWVKLFYFSNNIFCNSQVLSYYRIREGSMSTDFIPMKKGFLKAALLLQSFFKIEKNNELYKISKEKYKEVKTRNKVSLKNKLKSKLKILRPIYIKYVKKN